MTSSRSLGHRAGCWPTESAFPLFHRPPTHRDRGAVVDAMHTAMNEVVMVWVVACRRPACSPGPGAPLEVAVRRALAGEAGEPASSIFIPAATKAAELALMVPVVGTL